MIEIDMGNMSGVIIRRNPESGVISERFPSSDVVESDRVLRLAAAGAGAAGDSLIR
eukprot:COSAG02_NODE_1764_length_11026_cov_4.823465_7_plen_56_part_00